VSDERAEQRRAAGKRLLGGLLMAGGGMIALLCGACTLAFSFMFLGQSTSASEFGGIVLPLIIGGIPTGVGVVVFLIGLSVYKDGRAPRSQPWREFE